MPYPTEAPTTKPVEPVTKPPTTEVPTTKEPETTPKPTEPPTTALKENVYVFNDDGTINFKESKINLNRGLPDELIKYTYESNEVKNLMGNLYNKITRYGASKGNYGYGFYACINNEYFITIGFNENWKAYKNGLCTIYNPNNLPVKEDW